MTVRIISFITGYILGNILFACIVVKKVSGKSPFDIGSGNPGMANVMAECGFKAGIAVLVGDLLKTAAACFLCRFILFDAMPLTACLYAGFGAMCGHCFPAWHRFNGGKGVAAVCAAIFCLHPLFGITAMLAGAAVVLITKYLSAGAVVIPAVFIPFAFLLCGGEGAGVYVIITLIMIIRHKKNLAAILNGSEKKITLKKNINK